MPFTYSTRGQQLTESFEGLRLHSYQDGAGVWTIGYGHTGKDVGSGMSITFAQAISLLMHDTAGAVACVNHACTGMALTQGQFDALVDFCFNVGAGHFLNSTLLQCLQQGRADLASSEFGKWTKVAGKISEGLVRRRAAERALFLEAA